MRPHRISLALVASVLLGCSAEVSDAGAGGGGAGEVSADARPPARGLRHAADGPGAVFAMTKLFFGDVDRSGKRDPLAWRDLGFDIDGQNDACEGVTCAKIQHCGALPGASPSTFSDGNAGIDNSFGAHLVGDLVRPLYGDFSTRIAEDLTEGKFTLLFAIDGLGAAHDYDPLVTRVYRGAALGHSPAFDGSDRWPVTDESLLEPPDLRSSRSVFATSWVVSDRWVSGVGELTLHLPFLGNRLELVIHHAVVTMDLSEDRSRASNGTISGILDPTELAQEAPRLAGSIDPALCRNKGVSEVQEQILQAADIRSDGQVGAPDVPCDGVSIGLGFEARRVLLGEVRRTPPPADACSD